MKKITLLLLLISQVVTAQLDIKATTLKITNNVEDNAATKVAVQSSDGKINWILKSSIVGAGSSTNLTYTPTTRTVNSSTGTGFVFPIATGTDFGLSQNDFTNALKSKLDATPTSFFDGVYSSLTGIPSTFTPSSHTHVIGDVTSLQTTIDNKVADFINDNATTIAPSQNAVFDALALKANTSSVPTLVSQLTNDSGYITSVPAQSFASLTGKPTTLSGYGITDAYPLSGNPSGFLTSFTETDPLALKIDNNFSDVTNTATARTNLGLGTLATQSGTFSGTSSGTNTGDNAVNSNYSPLVASQLNNKFWASPNGSAGVASFRDIQVGDIPTLNQNTTGTASNITATSNSTITTLSNLALPQSQVTNLVSDLSTNSTNDRNRTNHTGTQTASTISDFNTAVASTATIKTNNLSDVANVTTARNNILPSKTGNANKFLRVNAGETDYELVTISGGGDALTTNPLSQFASTTSSQLAGVVSDETGTGNLVFSSVTDAKENKLDEDNVISFTDFTNAATTANPPFVGAAISTGTNAANTTNLNKNRPGIARMTSSTTANGGYKWQTDVASIRLGGNEVFTCGIAPVNFTTTTMYAGFHDSVTSALPVDGVYFKYSTSGAVVLETANNSTRTPSATIATLSLNTWYKLKITMNSNATSALGEIFDASGTLLGSASLTTNIPTTAGREVGAGIVVTESTTTATAMLDLDFLRTQFTLIR